MHVHYSILLIHWTFVVEQFPKLLYDFKKRVARKTNLEAGDYRDNRSFVRLDRTNRNIPLGNLTKQVFNEQRSDVISQTCCKKEEEREVKRNKRLNCCRVKSGWMFMVSGIKSFQLKKQVVLGANRGIFTRRSKDDAGSLECVCPKDQRMVSITCHSVRTVHGNY